MHPGQRNGLDALCKRYGIDNSQRDLHGALLDAELLLDVYLAMTGGQGALILGEDSTLAATGIAFRAVRPVGVLVVRRALPAESAAHDRILDLLDKASSGRTVWRALAANA
jgi:DNA polymerase-3 subunit epsilon